MDYMKHSGRIFEITTISQAHSSGYRMELADLSADGGLLAEVNIRAGTIIVVTQQALPVKVYAWWASAVTSIAVASERDWPNNLDE